MLSSERNHLPRPVQVRLPGVHITGFHTTLGTDLPLKSAQERSQASARDNWAPSNALPWSVPCLKEKPTLKPSPSWGTQSMACPKLSQPQPQAPLGKSLRLPPDSAIRWSRLSAPWINTAGWGWEFLTFPGLRGDLRSLGSIPGQTGCRHQHWWREGEQCCCP